MPMSEFLAADHHRLLVRIVVFGNAAFALITLMGRKSRNSPFPRGARNPQPRLREPCARLRRAGPAVVGCRVAADEVPNSHTSSSNRRPRRGQDEKSYHGHFTCSEAAHILAARLTAVRPQL